MPSSPYCLARDTAKCVCECWQSQEDASQHYSLVRQGSTGTTGATEGVGEVTPTLVLLHPSCWVEGEGDMHPGYHWVMSDVGQP